MGGGGVMGGVAFRNENSRLNSQLTWLPGTGPFNCLTTHMMMATTTTRSEKLFQRAAAAATSMSLTIRKGVGKGARGGGGAPIAFTAPLRSPPAPHIRSRGPPEVGGPKIYNFISTTAVVFHAAKTFSLLVNSLQLCRVLQTRTHEM